MSTVHVEGPFTRVRPALVLVCALILAAISTLLAPHPARAQDNTFITLDIPAPDAGNEAFGERIYVLPNGNFVVIDSKYDQGGAVDVGAVYLYRALPARQSRVVPVLISRLTGSTAGDRVGSNGIVILANGNFVVVSPLWNGDAFQLGAVTFVDAASGLDGVVSATNSLVGASPGDMTGSGGVYALTNGNYVVSTPRWDDGAIADVGAVTWLRGYPTGTATTATSGLVGPGNSLFGAAGNTLAASVIALANGDYLYFAGSWDNGALADAGIVGWGEGVLGSHGALVDANNIQGESATGGSPMRHDFSPLLHYILIGRPADNIVSLLLLPNRTWIANIDR